MIDQLREFKRDCYCGDLNESNIGDEVRLLGWVDTVRDHGGVIFINLRDREGVVQVVFDPSKIGEELYNKAKKLKSEYVIGVRGRVYRRPAGTENPKMKTGNIEVAGEELLILNTSKALPFPIEDNIKVSEEVRLKYRYLDLRRPSIAASTGDFFNSNRCLSIFSKITIASSTSIPRAKITPVKETVLNPIPKSHIKAMVAK